MRSCSLNASMYRHLYFEPRLGLSTACLSCLGQSEIRARTRASLSAHSAKLTPCNDVLTATTFLNPAMRSAFRSSKSSNPIDKRTGGTAQTALAGQAPGSYRNLLKRGSAPASDTRRCSMRDSTPPRLVAGCGSRVSQEHLEWTRRLRTVNRFRE